MRSIIFSLGIAVTCLLGAGMSQAGEMTYGCAVRPACGKICKLVCETKKLQAVGYGYKCESICIPSHSRHGSKHCDVTCCAGDDLEGYAPKIEFCWYDWFACGCATPRTVKVLTKYQAEREVSAYHWEVMDATTCGCVAQNGGPADTNSIYKPAPPDAEVGKILAVTDQEWEELSPMLNPQETPVASLTAEQPVSPPSESPETTPKRISVAERLQSWLRK
jgi:hypothetical protein